MNNIQKAYRLGQAVWIDTISRQMLQEGEFERLISSGVAGVTSNPTIFDNALRSGTLYEEEFRTLAQQGIQPPEILTRLMMQDIRSAAALFMPVYKETDAQDGYVSIEVSPLLANDTEGTLQEARRLWQGLDMPNIMIKVPGTPAGMPAIRTLISEGINVNVTLLFGIDEYSAAAQAYIDGLADRASQGHQISRVASVASFFVSRVDTMVDARLPEGHPLRGTAAVNNARLAYSHFRQKFSPESPFGRLAAKHAARPQRPLWASTSTKNPAYPDTIYVDGLIGKDTVNTMPLNTLDAMLDHSQVADALGDGSGADDAWVAQLKEAGVSMDDVTRQLLKDGVQAFADSFQNTLSLIEGKLGAPLSHG